MASARPEAVHRAAFDAIDGDGSGVITFAEFKQSIVDVNEMLPENKRIVITDEALRAKIAALDSSKDGKVSWDEYIGFMRDRGFVAE